MKAVFENPFLVRITKIPEERGWKRKFVLALRVLLVSVHRFNVDDCLMKASGLAYTTIVTLVPTLTVVVALLTVASGIQGRQDEIYDEVNSFLLKNNIQFDISPYWETLSDIINTASQIGAVGFIVFIFSATAVLRSLEKTFHSIWKIDLHRSFISKFVLYFFLISFGPLLFLVGKGLTDQLADSIRAPHLKSIVKTEMGEIWVAGEKGNIGRLNDLKSKIKFIPYDTIDFENLLCIDFSGIEKGTCKVPNVSKENFFRIRALGENLYAMSEEGTLLISDDHGGTWDIHSFKNLSIKDFGVSNDSTIFILTEDTRTLRYDIGSALTELRRFTEKGIKPFKIRFFGDKDGFILDREGRIWKTVDGGTNFTFQVISKKSLNDIFFLNRNVGFVVGDDGAIFKTKDGGNNWIDLSHKKFSYERVWAFLSPKKQDFDVFVLNNVGEIILSEDEGLNWTIAYKPKGGAILDLLHLRSESLISGLSSDESPEEEIEVTETKEEPETLSKLNADMLGILGVGEYNKIIRIENDDNGKPIWKKYQGGLRFFSLYTLLKFIVPFFGVWIFFVLLYSIIPNTKVPIKASFLGAAITGLILILFFWGFLNIYITSFTEKTMIIYKALAAIPILLLTIYSVALIILFGAEITATLQFPDRYLLPRHPFESMDTFVKHELYHTIRFLGLVYWEQETKGKLIQTKQIRKDLLLPEADINQIQTRLEQAQLISVSESGGIAPVKLKEQLSLLELYEKTVSVSFSAPTETKASSETLVKSLVSLEEKVRDHLKGITIKDLST
ncbi:ribonuclease BN [Leptospira ryugenii]|uniref:Ribonuclease BN n=1 Tax=Leptospira ryugenii TaxID=1917863 RepID=A0A2P2DXC1_9LEPT|nr:YhjD/YihY/BrkB family envelope integrity protein [Leptospira ryugenii]GBF49281.1 ribonuclease BN [Leptospira ryugenii]